MLDFVIIGGGVAGLSAAAALAPGARVLVLEAEETLGYHASGRSAALYEADYGAPATVALARASEAGLRAQGVLSPRGLMLVGKADEARDFAREAEALCLSPLTPAEAIARVPILNPATLAFAAATETAQDIDTDRLMQGYARAIRAAGGVIRTAAPVTAIVATDFEFYEHLPRLYPHADARSWFAGMPEKIQSGGFRNGTLQGAYLILAARALGLDCGPMSGFDNEKVDQEFFAGTPWKSNFLVNLGYGDRSRLHPRSPRFDFDDACRIL